ncbi:MAG TPA: hypothetical protein VKA21_08610 [Candidatus Binatia bacterium]|nr:hypothetical protein [Candidatus Binatia bacterium]
MGTRDASAVDTRLAEAAARGETLEMILVLRGSVRPAGSGRWRVRLVGGRVVTFGADAVIAATPVPAGRRR